jgi:exopolysaccharide biosynthesis protein
MKMPVRILLILLCAVLIIAIPFTVSSPNLLNDVKMELMNEGEEEIDFGRLFFSYAAAEEEVEEEALDEEKNEDTAFEDHPEWTLPFDFTVPPAPDAALYNKDSYEDETIRVRLEHQEMDDGTKMHIAYIRIADPSQLRTGVANPEKPASTRTKTVKAMAKAYNAVIALNGDNYTDNPKKTSFEYRMTTRIRSSSNRFKDILIIDDLGDFHLFVQSQGIKEYSETMKKEGRKLINAFTFGPALVKDGELLELDKDYGYNPNGREPRTAIGQMGPLSYVLVIVQAKDRDGKTGMSQGKLAEFMHELGCVQAFNLDGGNSAEMVFGKKTIKGMPGGDERTLSDIIYFATMQP